MTVARSLTILGGGPAGLAVGFAARGAGVPFRIYEAQNRVGGNCITIRHGDFRFDSGAHRFHDKDPRATRDVRRLLGAELRRINVPSQIWHGGRFFDFPIAPFNLLRRLGPVEFVHAAGSLLNGRLRGRQGSSFRDFAVRTYGADIASRFLLNYSEKLWGAPSDCLSPAICGSRLKGLGLTSLVIEALLGRSANTRHLDGSFFYPREGYGTIVERLAEFCGAETIELNSRISRIIHADQKIQSFEIGDKRVAVDELVSSLPLGLMLHIMRPLPPRVLLDTAAQLRYRNVVLVAIFLAKEQITPNGSVYFPDPTVPFTRVYEPRNRSAEMAPAGMTSLVAEIPCQPGDAIWKADQETLISLVADHYRRIGWIVPKDIVGGTIHRMPHAYPILELGYEQRLLPITEYLGRFGNLRLAGRNGCFVYSHLHDMLRSGYEIVSGYEEPAEIRRQPVAHRSKVALRRAA